MHRVSIIIPCRNGMPFLKSTLESVLSQSFHDYEVVYVDNQSTDDSYACASEYAKIDSRIRVLKNDKDLGMTGNWNRGCELATGEYLKVLCADDILYQDCLKEQVGLLDRLGNVSIVTSPNRVINAADQHLLTRCPMGIKPSDPPGLFTLDQAVRYCIKEKGNNLGEPSLITFRKSAFLKAGPFNDSYFYATDFECWLRMLAHGDLGVTSGIQAGYRLHGGALTNSVMQKGVPELCRIFRQYDPKIDDKPFDDKKFERDYARQIILKRLIIGASQKVGGRFILNCLDEMRLAFI